MLYIGMRNYLIRVLVCFSVFMNLPFSAMAEEKKDTNDNYFNKEEFIKTAKDKKTLPLSIADCIILALKNNSEIRIASVNPKIKADDIKIAWAEFEPTFSLDYSLSDSAEKANNSLLGANVSTARQIDLDASVSGKLITGTSYELDFLNTRYSSNSVYQTINPSYEAEPKLTLKQPLLRGFGVAVNKADITIAQNNKLVSLQTVKNIAIDIITKTKTVYYNYIYYNDAYSIAKNFVEMAEDLLRINQARYKEGLISSVDLLETEAAVLSRRRNLITAEIALKRAEDELKFVTNLVDDPKTWYVALELTDRPLFDSHEVDLVDSLVAAFKNRPDYEAKIIELKNKDINIKVAKNTLYPTVDLVASFGLNGLGSDYSESLNSIDADYKDWVVGVSLSLPWGGGDRAAYNKTILEKAQGLMELKRLEQSIILDVRDKVRGVDLVIEQVKATKLAKESQLKNYEAQKERYAAGQVSTHDMLDYQDKYARAVLDYMSSLIDYNIALVNLDKSEGLTLEKNNVKLEVVK